MNDFLTNKELYGTTLKVTHFAVLDMDGDKVPEVVLELTVGTYVQFYEILHYINGEVHGYNQVLRGLEHLKIDGTFAWANSAFNDGYGKLLFQPNSYEVDKLGYHDSKNNAGSITTSDFINNKPVTEDEYTSFMKEQDEKKDVIWYEFAQKNIEAEIIDNQFNSNIQSNNLNQESKKQEYKAKLDNIELGFKGFDSATASTNDMYQEACKNHKQWDDELNEIYGVLKIQLSESDMKNLQIEEVQWIKDRDIQAKNDSAEMLGGSMEKVLYEVSLANSTNERCYILVDKYMR